MKIFLAKSGQPLGPFALAEAHDRLSAGEIAETDLAWYDGLAGWTPLTSFLSLPPPLPPKEVQPEAIYHYIPVGRLIGMSIATVNLYQVYWSYRNWR
ncbi:hypothetical protein BH09VER1_BH09VER1_54640 [soil metagenome]